MSIESEDNQSEDNQSEDNQSEDNLGDEMETTTQRSSLSDIAAAQAAEATRQ